MWVQTYSKTFKNIKKEDIWKLWTDINNWPTWHDDLDYCKLDGKFEVGNSFILKPKGVNPVKILLTEIHKKKSFTDCTSFFGAKMYDTHSMEETKNGLKITNKIVVTGALQWLWVKLVAQNVFKSTPKQIEDLAKLARKK
ncbi:MAG: polyketide cyclase [Alphaproteobacteria bacterium]|nr:polyketide cyclase [Alphaproteobacteria bacterium]